MKPIKAATLNMNTEFRPDSVAWPTLWLFIVHFFGFILSLYLAFHQIIEPWQAMILNTILIYLSFTSLHEASHSNIFYRGKYKKLGNLVIGHLSALQLLAPYRVFYRIHMIHHAYVNQGAKDPDFFARGSNPISLALRFLVLYFVYYYHDIFHSKHGKKHLVEAIVFNSILAVLLYQFCQLTSLEFFLNIWVYPFILAVMTIVFIFDYIPHHPHDDASRQNNARTIEIPLLKYVMMYQNYHIIHHYAPRVPFYRYQFAFKNRNQDLQENHHRIFPTSESSRYGEIQLG